MKKPHQEQISVLDLEAVLSQRGLPKPQASKQILADVSAAFDEARHNLGWARFWRGRKVIYDTWDTGFLQWPRKIQQLVSGRKVLDFGVGAGLHPIGYVAVGASEALGYDPFYDYSTRSTKSKNTGKQYELAFELHKVHKLLSGVRFTNDFSDCENEAPFECVVLHNVTEHLPDVGYALDQVAGVMAEGSLLVFHHHNFFSWDGHHTPPKTEDKIDPSDPRHRELIDWAHLDFDPPNNHPIIRSTLNRITLDELRREVEARFDVLLWQEIPSPENRGAGRFGNIPANALDEYSWRDLTTKNVLGVAVLNQSKKESLK